MAQPNIWQRFIDWIGGIALSIFLLSQNMTLDEYIQILISEAREPDGVDSEVLPCPFCGKIPDVRESISKSESGVFIVTCANFDEKNGCVIRPNTGWYLPEGEQDGRTRAISAWNKRAIT